MQPQLKLNTFKHILATAAVMLIGWLISAGYIYFAVDNTAKNEALKSAQTSAKQAALSIQPYLLANDIISLNVYINSLTEARLINGVAVYNEQDELIARAGTETGATKDVVMGSPQTPMGHVTLYISHQPQKAMLESFLWPIAVLSLSTMLVTLVSLWFSLKQQAAEAQRAKSKKTNESVIIIEDLNAPENQLDTINTSSDVNNTSSSDEFKVTLTEAIEASTPETPESAETTKPLEQEDALAPSADPHEDEQQSLIVDTEALREDSFTLINDDIDSHAPNTHIINEPASKQQGSAADVTSTDEEMDNEALVELLRPDPQSKQRMPQFVPSQPNDKEADPEIELDIFNDEPAPVPALTPQIQPTDTSQAPEKSNPLRDRARPEVQLDLYTLEHQLELTLQPQDAAYLIYIDATTGHADYVEPEEHELLLDAYEAMIRQVASIYGGQLTVSASGDLQLFFDDQSQDDSHGIHATCAAKLFTLLYRAFNQQRIKSFSPVLNLHMAIVRGNRQKFALIKEEALFLTRTTQSNELISHTALTEARHLKETIMTNANIRREDEDKVLILSLGESYQHLLRKQAEHLLLKN